MRVLVLSIGHEYDNEYGHAYERAFLFACMFGAIDLCLWMLFAFFVCMLRIMLVVTGKRHQNDLNEKGLMSFVFVSLFCYKRP